MVFAATFLHSLKIWAKSKHPGVAKISLHVKIPQAAINSMLLFQGGNASLPSFRSKSPLPNSSTHSHLLHLKILPSRPFIRNPSSLLYLLPKVYHRAMLPPLPTCCKPMELHSSEQSAPRILPQHVRPCNSSFISCVTCPTCLPFLFLSRCLVFALSHDCLDLCVNSHLDAERQTLNCRYQYGRPGWFSTI